MTFKEVTSETGKRTKITTYRKLVSLHPRTVELVTVHGNTGEVFSSRSYGLTRQWKTLEEAAKHLGWEKV